MVVLQQAVIAGLSGITRTEVELGHPFETNTVYVMEEVSVTVILDVVSPFDQ